MYLIHASGTAEYTNCISIECPDYDTKQPDGEVPIMPELWGMQTTPLLPLIPGPLGPEWYHLIGSYLWVK